MIHSSLGQSLSWNMMVGAEDGETGKKERKKRKERRGKRKEQRGKRKEKRGRRKEQRGKRKEKRGNRKQETGRAHVLLGADVLVLLRVARHFPDADAAQDVLEVEPQVLPRDGQHGAALPGARLRGQLAGRRGSHVSRKQHMLPRAS